MSLRSLASPLVLTLLWPVAGCTFGQQQPDSSADSSVDTHTDSTVDSTTDSTADSTPGDSADSGDTDTDTDTDTATGDCPRLDYSPTSLSFDGGAVGVAYDQFVTVTNNCTAGIDLDMTVTMSPGRGPFTRLSNAEMIIPQGLSDQIEIEFVPPNLDPQKVDINLTTNDPSHPSEVIKATGTPDADLDNDGYDSNTTRRGDDCDDSNPDVHPGATEIWYDGIDENCDGKDDYDQDGDGLDSALYGGTDCDDTNASIGAGGPETQNGIDDDCDGLVDEDFINAGDVYVSEFMPDSSNVADEHGEYFELYNSSDNAIDLEGWTFHDDGTDSFSIVGSLIVDSGGYVVLGVDDNTASNGGVPVDYQYDHASFNMTNSDSFYVMMGTTDIFDLDYSGWAITSGAAMNLDRNSFSSGHAGTETYWCDSTSMLDDGDYGTPGGQNDVCF